MSFKSDKLQMTGAKMRHFEILLQDCDADIRGGKPHHVIRRLAQVGTSRIPREWRLPLAKICRRAGLYSLGLRLLTRLASGPSPKASPAEMTEYSALLIRSGAVDEALENLEKLNAQEVPEAFLIRAFAHFTRWEYRRGALELENYLRAPLSNDATLVGRSNLAFAHVELREHGTARGLLEENIRMTRDQGYRNLEAYNVGLLAQVYLQEGNFSAARKTISVTDISKSQTYNDWSVEKLRLIIDGLENKDAKPFALLRKLAREKKDWQALRDADLFSLKVNFSEERFLHLYFGSPLPEFRKCIEAELGCVPDRSIYVLGKKSAPRFDLEAGEVDGANVVRAGFKCHQLLRTLLKDFYQPMRVGGLHAALNPNEHFDIVSSPDRVHQIVRRTRLWLKQNSLPVRIQEDEGFYSLVIDGNLSFRVSIDQQPADIFGWRMEKIKSIFPDARIFSAREIQDELGISETSAHRLLQRAIEAGRIERLGKTKRPSGYRISKSAA